MDKETLNSEYFDSNDRKALATILMQSRAESGLSQEKVALELGIAKKTVQNWERGVSAPSLPQAIEWFRVMNVPAMPYFLRFIFPDLDDTYNKSNDNSKSSSHSNKSDDDRLRKELINVIETLPQEGVRQLMYLFYGDHGSSPRGILNMLTAHLQTPLRDRYSHANAILNDYKLSTEMNKTVKPNRVQPNLTLLENAIEQGHDAIINNKNNYMLISKEKYWI